jgi:hypothetical protein
MFPKNLEVGLVISTHKKGNKNKWENYRGIILLLVVPELYANILKNKLDDYTEDCLEEEQCGFRKQRGCMNAVFILQQVTEKQQE